MTDRTQPLEPAPLTDEQRANIATAFRQGDRQLWRNMSDDSRIAIMDAVRVASSLIGVLDADRWSFVARAVSIAAEDEADEA